MGKHDKNHSAAEAQKQAKKIVANPIYLSRFLALCEGIRRAGEFEEKLNISEQDLDGQNLIEFVEELAPEIEENIILGKI